VTILLASADRLTVAASTGDGADQVAGLDAPRGDVAEPLATVMSELRPVITRDLPADPLRALFGVSFKTKALGLIPIVNQESLIAVMVCDSDEPVFDESAEAIGILSVQIALALERITLTTSLQQSAARFRSLIQSSSDVIALTDSGSRTQYASPSIDRVLGYSPEERVERSAFELIHPDDVPSVHARFADLSAEPAGSVTMELRVRHKNGSWRWGEGTATNLLDDPAVQAIVINYRDVSERRALQERLTHQAFHDPLTNLANRALLKDRIEHALDRRPKTHGRPWPCCSSTSTTSRRSTTAWDTQWETFFWWPWPIGSEKVPPPRRHSGALGRRRVRDSRGGHAAFRGCHPDRGTYKRSTARTLHAFGQAGVRGRQHRARNRPFPRRRDRRAAARRRYGDVRRQEPG
jgi:PAS domain S-box-containing protein